MLEQTIYLKMVEIAGQFPKPYTQQYLDATAHFGLPYCTLTSNVRPRLDWYLT
jgi:hypothetical protein